MCCSLMTYQVTRSTHPRVGQLGPSYLCPALAAGGQPDPAFLYHIWVPDPILCSLENPAGVTLDPEEADYRGTTQNAQRKIF